MQNGGNWASRNVLKVSELLRQINKFNIWAICLSPEDPLGLLPNYQLWVSGLVDTQDNQPSQFSRTVLVLALTVFYPWTPQCQP